MPKLSYRELQRRLEIFEECVGDLDRSRKKVELQATYDQILIDYPGIESMLEEEKEPAPAPEPIKTSKVESEIETKSCRVCGENMANIDGWWRCGNCPHKEAIA